MFDIVVPVYNSLHHARSCLESIFLHSTLKSQLYIVDDGCEPHTSNELANLATRSDNIILIKNDGNQGYLNSVNKAAAQGDSEFIVFINSDTVVPPGYLERVLKAFRSDHSIGVVSAVSNWANWTRVCWAVPPGHNIYSVNELLSEVVESPVVDIDNASGFFFAVRRSVFEQVGGFDKIYGSGYWEEADFCMKALNLKLRVVVDAALFVYHHGWGSFKQTGRNENMERNKQTFMSRWEQEYRSIESKWKANNPISYMEREVLEDKAKYPKIFEVPVSSDTAINSAKAAIEILKNQNPPPSALNSSAALSEGRRVKVVYILPAVKVYGGIISVLQVVNQLILRGIDANICTWGDVDENALKLFPMFFQPQKFQSIQQMVENFPTCDLVVATSWDSVYPAYVIQQSRSSLKACYFVQDYEPDFYTGAHPDLERDAHRTYYMIDQKIVKTEWLKRKLKPFPGDVHRIPLGLNLDFFYDQNRRTKPQILALGRPQSRRRNFDMVVSVYEEINKLRPDVTLALYGFGYNASKLPFPCKDYGLLSSMEAVSNALNDSDILLDCSTFQGFGRPGLEAMACGAYPILTREGGITQYAKHNYNCTLIDPLNKEDILTAIFNYYRDPESFADLKANGRDTAEEYSLVREGQTTAQLFRKILFERNQQLAPA